MTEPVAEGGCLCGEIRFKATGEPIVKVYCHCRDCRRASGSPVTAFAAYPNGKADFIQGMPRVCHSSPGVRRSFCSKCGASVSYETDRIPGTIYLCSSLFDDPEKFEPEAHGWVEQRIGWLRLEDDLPGYEGTSQPQ